MSKQELIAKLLATLDNPDTEDAHWIQDRALLEYIDDPEVTEAYDKRDKWYA